MKYTYTKETINKKLIPKTDSKTKPETPKKGWELTKKEMWEEIPGTQFDKFAKEANKEKFDWYENHPAIDAKVRFDDLSEEIIKNAIKQGHKIPDNVLKDYSELNQKSNIINFNENIRVFTVHKDDTPVTMFQFLTEKEANKIYNEQIKNKNAAVVTWDKQTLNEQGGVTGVESVKMKIIEDNPKPENTATPEKQLLKLTRESMQVYKRIKAGDNTAKKEFLKLTRERMQIYKKLKNESTENKLNRFSNTELSLIKNYSERINTDIDLNKLYSLVSNIAKSQNKEKIRVEDVAAALQYVHKNPVDFLNEIFDKEYIENTLLLHNKIGEETVRDILSFNLNEEWNNATSKILSDIVFINKNFNKYSKVRTLIESCIDSKKWNTISEYKKIFQRLINYSEKIAKVEKKNKVSVTEIATACYYLDINNLSKNYYNDIDKKKNNKDIANRLLKYNLSEEHNKLAKKYLMKYNKGEQYETDKGLLTIVSVKRNGVNGNPLYGIIVNNKHQGMNPEPVLDRIIKKRIKQKR